MKKILLILSVLLTLSSFSQLESVMLNWNYSLSDSITHATMQEIYIDGDTVSDMRISDSYHASINIVEVLLHDGHLNADNHLIIDDCPVSNNWSNEEIDGYIYTSLTETEILDGVPDYNYSNETVKMPFNFNGGDGNHCGFLFVKYLNYDITVQGYIWNTVADAICSCNTSGTLGVDEIKLDYSNLKFSYYNLLGQKVYSPKGLVLKVYENGFTQKVFIE